MLIRRMMTLPILACVLGTASGCSSSGYDPTGLGQETIVQRADNLLLEGRPRDAAELYCSAAARWNAPALREKEALAWLVAGDTDLATSALAAAPLDDSTRGQTLAAVLATRQDRTIDALAHLNRAITLDEANAAAWALKGEILLQQDDFGRAASSLAVADGLLEAEDALKRDVLRNLSLARLMGFDYVGADEAFSSLLRIQGEANDDDMLFAGALAYAVRDHARAAEYWRQLDADVRRELAQQLGNESAAYEVLVQAYPSKERHEL